MVGLIRCGLHEVLHVEQFNCLYFQTMHCNYLINNRTIRLRKFFDSMMTDRLLGSHCECRNVSFEMHNRGEPLLAVFNMIFRLERATLLMPSKASSDKGLFKLLPSLVTAHFSFAIYEETVYDGEIQRCINLVTSSHPTFTILYVVYVGVCHPSMLLDPR